MRHTVKLVSFIDENTGELGLGLKDMPRNEETNTAIDGMLIAHDIIEHVNGAKHIGSIDDELEAMGALWYTRGQWGDLRRDGRGSMYTPAQSVASDITRMFTDYFFGATLAPAPVTKACEMDDEFNEIIKIATSQYKAELDGENCTYETLEYNKVALSRMRMGYRKAKRKYEKHGRFAANNLFWTIAECMNVQFKHIHTEGQEFKLSYGFNENRCSFARLSEVEDY